MIKNITAFLIASLTHLLAAASVSAIPIFENFPASKAAEYVIHYLGLSAENPLTDDIRQSFENPTKQKGGYGYVLIPHGPQEGDYVVKFSTGGSSTVDETRNFQTIAHIFSTTPPKGFACNIPVAIFTHPQSRESIQVLPYVPHEDESLITLSLMNIISREATDEDFERVSRLGHALGKFQAHYYDENDETTLAHRDLHSWNIIESSKLTLIDMGTMERGSLHIDPIYLTFLIADDAAKSRFYFTLYKDGYRAMLYTFYKAYIEILPKSAQRTLQSDYCGKTAFKKAKRGTPLCCGLYIYAREEFIALQNQVVQSLLADYLPPKHHVNSLIEKFEAMSKVS